MFNVLAMMAEFEFDLIRARIRKEGRSRNAVSLWARNLLVNGVGARLTSPAAACCLEGADFSPNSAVVGLRMRPAHWCSLAPVYAICVNKTQIDNVAARPCRRLALAIDLHVTPLTGTANDQFRSALGRKVNRGLRR